MAEYTSKDIIAAIKKSRRQLKTRELARKMKISQAGYKFFRKTVKEAIADGKIIKGRGGKLSIPQMDSFVFGKLFISYAGHGFVIPDEGHDDFFISRRDMGGAIHGEKVKVILKPDRGSKSREGKIVEVIDRESGRIVGKIRSTRDGFKVMPTDPRNKELIDLSNPKKHPIKKDMIVTVRLKPWKATYLPPEGIVEEVLGMEGAPGVDIDSLVVSFGLPEEFDNRVKPELAAIRKAVTRQSLTGREDYRSITTFTIDPSDAKDHDDAVSLEKLHNGKYRLGVHIADVSHFVKPGSALESEGLLRGNSVYLVDRVIPMLPEKLSADICSLHENEDRLTVSFMTEIDIKGKIYKWEFVESVIKSSASLSYEEAQAYLDGSYKGNKISSELGNA